MEILTKADGLMLILGYSAAMLGIIALLKKERTPKKSSWWQVVPLHG